MKDNKLWINKEDWDFENQWRKEQTAKIFPLMNKTDEEIEAEVRALEADGKLQQIGLPEGTTYWTNKEGMIQFDIAMRKYVRDLLNK